MSSEHNKNAPKTDKEKPRGGFISRLFSGLAQSWKNRNNPSLQEITTYVFCHTKIEERQRRGMFSHEVITDKYEFPCSTNLIATRISGTDLYTIDKIERTRRGNDNVHIAQKRYDHGGKKAVDIVEAIGVLKKWEEDAMNGTDFDRIQSHQPYVKTHYSRHLHEDHKPRPTLIRLKPDQNKPQ